MNGVMKAVIVLIEKLCTQPEMLIMFLVILVMAYLLVMKDKIVHEMSKELQASIGNMSTLSTQLSYLLEMFKEKMR
jgi:hypothetical protein